MLCFIFNPGFRVKAGDMYTVMQEETLAEVETWTVIWWPIVSEMFLPRTIRIWLFFFKLKSIMSGMFLVHSVERIVL